MLSERIMVHIKFEKSPGEAGDRTQDLGVDSRALNHSATKALINMTTNKINILALKILYGVIMQL